MANEEATLGERPMSYRTIHQKEGYGTFYGRTYQAGYYAALWDKIEKPLLERTLKPLGGVGKTCLDFACGTGRITQVAAKMFDRVVGVDVSEEMLSCAQVGSNVNLYCVDITQHPLLETFDAVTAFRFFLNAEDSLRHEALRAIREHLRDDGRLVCNVHMNATSPMGWLYRTLRVSLHKPFHKTLSFKSFENLLIESGFRVEATEAYGYLPRPGRWLPGTCELLVEPAEVLCGALRIPANFAQSFLVVARKR